MTNWIKGMALAPRDRRIIKAFGIATWPDGTEHPEMRFIWRDWREMPAATIEEPNKVIRLDETWEPQVPHPFRPRPTSRRWMPKSGQGALSPPERVSDALFSDHRLQGQARAG